MIYYHEVLQEALEDLEASGDGFAIDQGAWLMASFWDLQSWITKWHPIKMDKIPRIAKLIEEMANNPESSTPCHRNVAMIRVAEHMNREDKVGRVATCLRKLFHG